MDVEKHVLIVDDDDDVRAMLAETLEYEGYHVLGARNGRDALAQLRSGTAVCAVLLDLVMPIMDGWRLLEEMSRDPALARVPVFVLSGIGSTEDEARLSGTPVAGIPRKPLDVPELLAAIGCHC
jgi:CheY-like chemotaxis protein